MRFLAVTVAAVLGLTLAATARAERRMFIIAADGGGYGIDRCLEAGAKCGAAAANAYCRSHDYVAAASFRKVDRDDITGTIPAGGGCIGNRCNDLVAIVCSR
jgi:hypothetical protein